MAENSDFGVDPEIAQAMGFSSFGMQPGKKRKLNTDAAWNVDGESENSIAVDSKNPATRSSASSRALSHGISKVAADKEYLKPGAEQESAAGTIPPHRSTDTASKIDGNDAESLRALQHGVRNENGDMVYFLPSFLEDPWRNLRAQ